MDPNDIELSNLTKSFEYVKFSNQIDNIENIEDIKTLAKCYFKLYLKQQEIVSDWAIPES
jgi:uncharacterized pyridoxamine 5'-phosphate oxidase family protein